MACEIKAWKKEGCSLTCRVDSLSTRETSSKEINDTYGEGGGLNANFRTVEAVALVANRLGSQGMIYGVDFIFKIGSYESIDFDFSDQEVKALARTILSDVLAE
jgi:hypothetical protein